MGGGATSTLPGTEEPSVIIQKTKGGKDKIPMQGAEFSFLFEAKAKAEDGEKISRQSCVLEEGGSFKGKSGVLEEGESFKGWSVLTLTRVKQKRSGD